MNIVIIKLFRNVDNSDYSEIMIDKFTDIIKDIKTYGKKLGETVLVNITNSESIINVSPEEYDCFAEITYTNSLTEDEKKFYIQSIKKLSTFGKVHKREMDIIDSLHYIVLKQIDASQVLKV